MSYESKIDNCYASHHPIAYQAAFQGFDCMKDEAKKIAAEADKEIRAAKRTLRLLHEATGALSDTRVDHAVDSELWHRNAENNERRALLRSWLGL